MKAFFLPIFFEIIAINGITKKELIKAQTEPWRAGQFPALAGSLLNK